MAAARSRTPPVTTCAPHVRDGLDLAGLMRAGVLALLPCVAAGAYTIGRQVHGALRDAGLDRAQGWHGDVFAALGLPLDPDQAAACFVQGLLYLVPLFVAALLATLACEWLFARIRRRALVPGAALQALVFALLVPPTLPLWQAVVGMAFGVVIGKEVFGGTGRNVVHPAVTAVAFLLLAWPASLRGPSVWGPELDAIKPTLLDQLAASGPEVLGVQGIGFLDALWGGFPGPAAAASPAAALLGGAYLLARRLIAWHTVAAVFLGALGTAWLWALAAPYETPLAGVPAPWHLVLGSLAFGAVFLATDPITSPATTAGRWIHGLLLGGVIVLLRLANPTHPEGTVLALLLGSVFAPLNDAFVVTFHKLRRRARG